MLLNNKKAQILKNIFQLSFGLIIGSAVFFIFSIVLFYIMFDYAITPFATIASGMTTDANTLTGISDVVAQYLTLYTALDWFFLLVIVNIMISSCIAAVKARTLNPFSFIGMALFGNIFMIFLLSFAVEAQSWILSEFAYNILLSVPNTPFITFWFNYDIFILPVFFLILLALNQIDIDDLRAKIGLDNSSDGSGYIEK